MSLAKKAAEIMRLMSDGGLERDALKAAGEIVECLDSGNTVFACGNGGSYADADHFVAELTGKLDRVRPPKSGVLLGSSGAASTAISNDFGFEQIFSRELSGIGSSGDILVCFSTSGASQNVINAALAAQDRGITVISISSKAESPLSMASDLVLKVDSSNTQTLQECHGIILHYLCELLDKRWIG